MWFRSSISYWAAAATLACGHHGSSHGTAPDTASRGGDAASAGTGSGAALGSAGASATPSCPPAPELGVRYVGRVDGCDPKGARYAWSGAGFVGRFDGTGVSVKLDDANQHTVLIDGQLAPKLVATGEDTYSLASGLPPGEHSFEVYRRTEPSFGVTLLQSVEVERGMLLEPPPPPARLIEIVGDSVSCGYGDEGTAPCTFSADTENNYLAYGSLLARSLDAEVSTIAISGKGVLYNYNGNKILPMPLLYDTTVPDDRKHPWSFRTQPDLVIINLGTNDFSASSDPTDELFSSSYEKLLTKIRSVYPNTFILCTVGPLLAGADLAHAQAGIQSAVEARRADGDDRLKVYAMSVQNTMPGCDAHPGLATHAAMAEALAAEASADLGW